MSELPNAHRMLESAERSVTAGDLVSADELLRDAARIQEAELGPLHPELANTLNNLAIVAERTGRQADAEKFYRRAAAITAVSLPPEHPMVAASRENLEDFCHAAGLPIDAPAFMTLSEQDTELGLGLFADEDKAEDKPEDKPEATAAPAPVHFDDALLTMRFEPLPETARSVPAEATPPRRASRAFAWAAIALVMVGSAALVVARTWSSRETVTTAPTAAATARPATPTPPPAAPTAPAATERASAPPPVEAPATVSANGISLATVDVCRTLSTSGGSWQCNPAGDSVAPGRVVFYTRVRSPRDATVMHRWYRGDTLQKSVPLKIRASANEGYRTYSQQAVDGGEDWRVEITTADGEVLHQQRFSVR